MLSLSFYVDKCDIILLKQHYPPVQFSYLHSSGKKWFLRVCCCSRGYTLCLEDSSQNVVHFLIQHNFLFSVSYQLLFCAVKVPEKYATGLISWSLLTDLQRTLDYALLEASVYSMYGLFGSGNCNSGLLQNISFRYSNACWHLSDHIKGVFSFSRLVNGRVIFANAGMNDL